MQQHSFKRILIIATRQIGDTLITTPLIQRAKEIWPEAQIDFLGFAHAKDILHGNPYLHQIIGTSQKPTLQEYLKILQKIFFQYDLAIITQPSDRSYIYGLFAASKRVGVAHPGKEDHGWKKWLTQYQVPIDYFQQHVITEKLRLLTPFQKNTNKPTDFLKNSQPEVFVTPPISVHLPIEIADISKDAIVLHPTPLNAYKRWPTANWTGLIEHLSRLEIPVIISGANTLSDQELNTEIIASLSESAAQTVTNMTGKLTLSELGTLLKHAKAYIGVDTAITHLAAACNTPTIALFGPTPPSNFGPWPNGFRGDQPYLIRASSQTQQHVTILQGPQDCVPCRKAGCDDHANSPSACLNELSLERVLAALDTTLQNSPKRCI